MDRPPAVGQIGSGQLYTSRMKRGRPDLRILQRPVFPEKNFFHRERFEKAFSDCIVRGISLSGHDEMTARQTKPAAEQVHGSASPFCVFELFQLPKHGLQKGFLCRLIVQTLPGILLFPIIKEDRMISHTGGSVGRGGHTVQKCFNNPALECDSKYSAVPYGRFFFPSSRAVHIIKKNLFFFFKL